MSFSPLGKFLSNLPITSFNEIGDFKLDKVQAPFQQDRVAIREK